MIEVVVYGSPAPAGALRIGRTKEGRSFLAHRSSKALGAWQSAIREAVGPVAPEEVYRGAVELRATFYVARPSGHFGARGLRPSAPAYPTKRATAGKGGDFDKLVRAVSDALTGIVFADDSQVVDAVVRKRYADRGPVRLELSVRALDEADAELELRGETS